MPSAQNTTDTDDKFLSWTQEDIEQRLGFRGGRFTSANNALTLIAAVLLSTAFYALMFYVIRPYPPTNGIGRAFLERGPVPYPTVLLFFWGISILFVKSRKLKFQRRTLDLAAVPQQAGFTLTDESAKTVLDRIHGLVDHPRHFILLNRIERALSNLRNIGRISDVSSLLRAQAENDEDQVSSSFLVLNGMVWAVPVLGFVGTVQGLSRAIGSFGQTLQATGDLGAIKASLQGVTGGLATGFEITLIALIFALILQLSITFEQQRELSFLDECNDYCHAHIVSKLRLLRRESAPYLEPAVTGSIDHEAESSPTTRAEIKPRFSPLAE
jgi:biopolymer transport protein ExbB/TolQ